MDIVKEIQNFESLDDKMYDLKRRMEYLQSREEDVRTELDYADSLSMKKRRKTVENWLTNVGRMKNQVQQLEQEITEKSFYNHLRLRKTVEKIREEVKELIQVGAFPEGLTLVAPDSGFLPLLTTELVGQQFEEKKNMIREIILGNDDILCIGIYGMGGVGKTTLIKHVYNELLNHSNSSVFWLVASQNFCIHKLQNDLANLVRANLTNEDEVSRRAAILAKALKRIKNPILILDDLWNDFPLENAGIVKRGGCKLVFTTRSLKVCHRMESHMQIRVDHLSDEEAWALFMKKLGTGTTITPQIEEIAQSLVKECAGLPLGINTVAGSMRGVDDICEWSNALETLRQATRGKDDDFENVFNVLRYSYDMLKNQTLQECFLYCSLYPEDHEILRDELIANFIDEGLISRMGSRRAEFYRGHTILNMLENVCLLQGGIVQRRGSRFRYVKMHDLVRDMALRIASESSRFLVEAGVKSAHVVDEKWPVDLERASFFESYISDIRFSVSPPVCPRLSTLLLSGCRNISVIPNSFFTHMNSLTVLDLSRTQINNLPVSVSNLKSLSALLLRACYNLKKLCALSDLTALKRLDLSYSGITQLPEGINLLTNLRDLSLFGAYDLQIIPDGILPRLSLLRRLELPTYGGRMKAKGEEIVSLQKLEMFRGKFYNINDLDRCLSSWEESTPEDYLLLVGDDSIYEVKDLKMEKVVHITRCEDLITLCQLESLKKATGLRMCMVDKCDQMTHLFCSACYNDTSTHRLEYLKLRYLWNLQDLLWGGKCESSSAAAAATEATTTTATPVVPTGAFSSLKELRIEGCHKIKSLTLTLLSHLQNLEKFIVSYCLGLTEIVQVLDEEQDQDQEAIGSIVFSTLPKLKVLKLIFLPELKSFCSSKKLVSDSLKEINIFDCQKLQGLPLLREDSRTPTSLECINVDKEWWESIEFDHPNTKDILKPICHFVRNKNGSDSDSPDFSNDRCFWELGESVSCNPWKCIVIH